MVACERFAIPHPNMEFGAEVPPSPPPPPLTLIPTCIFPSLTSSRGFKAERLMHPPRCCRAVSSLRVSINPPLWVTCKIPTNNCLQSEGRRVPGSYTKNWQHFADYLSSHFGNHAFVPFALAQTLTHIYTLHWLSGAELPWQHRAKEISK